MGNDLDREYSLELRHNNLYRRLDSLKTIEIGGEYYYIQEEGEKSEEMRSHALGIASTFLKRPIGVNTLVIKVSLRND
jgi:hypothetical protein